MANPWEKYQGAESTSTEQPGPWTKYQKPELQQPQMSRSEAMSKGGFTGLADVLGMPTDIIQMGVKPLGEALGIPITDKPFMGGQYLRELGEEAGLTYSDIGQIPEQHRPYAEGMRTFGSNVPFLFAPYALPAKSAGFLKPIAEFIRNNPMQFLTTEMIASTLSSIGGGLAEKFFPGEPIPRFIGEVATPLTPSALLLRSSGFAKKTIQNISAKLSKSGRESAAGEAIRRELESFREDVPEIISRAEGNEPVTMPEEELQAFDEWLRSPPKDIDDLPSFEEWLAKAPGEEMNLLMDEALPGEKLFLGELTGSPTLIALERKYIKEDPYLSSEHREMLRQTTQAYEQALRRALELGDKTALRDLAFINQQLYLDMLKAQVDSATAQAAKMAGRITPRGAPSQLSKNVRKILERSYSDFRRAEKALWNRVPSDVEIDPENVQNIIDTYQELRDLRLLSVENLPKPVEPFIRKIEKLIQETTEAAKDQIPEGIGGRLQAEAEQFMTQKGLEEVEPTIITTGELKRFRSLMLKAQRVWRDTDINLANMMGRLADATLEDLSTLVDVDFLDEARIFSYQGNNLFTRGKVGDLLSYNWRGGPRVEPELTLQKGMGVSGTAGDVGARQIEEAARLKGLSVPKDSGIPPLNRRSTLIQQEDFVKNLAESVINPETGRVNSRSLEQFRVKNKELLDGFPSLNKQLADAASAERFLKETEKASEQATKLLEQKSLFARLINTSDPKLVIGDILKGRRPIENYKELIQMARNSGPEAVAGLREATFDWIFSQAARGDMLSGKEILRILTAKPTRADNSVLELLGQSGVLNKQQLSNLEVVLKKMIRLENALEEGGQIGLILDQPNFAEDLIARLIGSNLAGSSMIAQNTGSSLLMAHAGSKWARSIMNQLPIEQTEEIIKHAIREPAFFVNIMTRNPGANLQSQIERQMNAFLWAAGMRLITEEEQSRTHSQQRPPGNVSP